MGLTLTQLLVEQTKEDFREALMLAMRGVGFVRKTGPGEGNLTLTGTAEDAYSVVIGIRSDGGLGTATFRYSLDGGDSTNGSDITVPSGGEYVLPDTGVTLVFENGPGDADQSFYEGDEFAFELTIPTLPTTSWHVGSTPRTIIEVDSEANEDFASRILSIAKSAFLSTAENDWLDLLVEEFYGLERVQGQTARHTVVLSDTGNGGPYTITAGQLVVGTTNGLRFSNITTGTLAQGGTLSLTFEAEQRGTAYNSAPGAINTLLTSLAGVSVANTAPQVRQGINRESDADLRARAALRWPSLGYGATADAYTLWATEASEDVTRTRVVADIDNPGTILVYLAGPNGAVSGDVEDEVDEYIQPRVPLGTVATVESATVQNVAIEATVYVRAGFSSQAEDEIVDNLTAFFQGGRNSIGELLPGIPISDGGEIIYLTALVEQIQIATGVRNVTLALPAANVTINDGNVAVISPAADLTFVEV